MNEHLARIEEVAPTTAKREWYNADTLYSRLANTDVDYFAFHLQEYRDSGVDDPTLVEIIQAASNLMTGNMGPDEMPQVGFLVVLSEDTAHTVSQESFDAAGATFLVVPSGIDWLEYAEQTLVYTPLELIDYDWSASPPATEQPLTLLTPEYSVSRGYPSRHGSGHFDTPSSPHRVPMNRTTK
jgi:hypothetical protein